MNYVLRKAAIILFLLGTIAGASERGPGELRKSEPRVDSLFSAWDRPNSPGCALGVIRHGELIYSRGYGMADVEKNIPISSATLFDIGSISKQFTSACILLLCEKGKLSLDDDVRTYIPELPDYGAKISIRHLLTHTSGLRDYPNLLVLAGRELSDVITADDALAILTRQKHLNFKPGDEWLYSNSGYFLASKIIERVAGQSMRSFLQENIFGPLGMTATTVRDDHAMVLPHRALGYSPQKGGGFRRTESNWELAGDGGIQTSIDDLLLWDRNFVNPAIGGSEMIRQMLTPGTLNNGDTLHYGLGVEIGTYKGLDIISHEGIWSGYHAEYIRFPGEDLSVICLCNCSSMNPALLTREVAEIYLAPHLKEAGPAAAGHAMTLSDADLSRYCGYFQSGDFQLTRRIVLRNNALVYERLPAGESTLEPIGNDAFQMLGVPIATTVTFTRLDSSAVTGMRVVSAGISPVVFEAYTPAIPTKERLQSFAGSYTSDELGVTYCVAPQDSQLALMTRGSDANVLKPVAEDVFRDSNIGTVTFTRDGEHSVRGFLLTQSRNRNIAFRKQ